MVRPRDLAYFPIAITNNILQLISVMNYSDLSQSSFGLGGIFRSKVVSLVDQF